jgi:hypothetical protein
VLFRKFALFLRLKSQKQLFPPARASRGLVIAPWLGPGFDLGKNTCQNGEKQGELSSKSIKSFPQGRESEEIGIFSQK